MMAEIRIHNDYKVTSDELQAVNVCCTQSQLSSSRFEYHIFAVNIYQFFRDFLCTVRRGIVDDDYFPIESAISHIFISWISPYACIGIAISYDFVKVFSSNQTMTGRFLRSL